MSVPHAAVDEPEADWLLLQLPNALSVSVVGLRPGAVTMRCVAPE